MHVSPIFPQRTKKLAHSPPFFSTFPMLPILLDSAPVMHRKRVILALAAGLQHVTPRGVGILRLGRRVGCTNRKKVWQQAIAKGTPPAGGGGGGGRCLWPWQAPNPHPHQKNFPRAKKDIYQRDRIFEADFKYANFFWPLTHPPHGGRGGGSPEAIACLATHDVSAWGAHGSCVLTPLP